MAVSLDGPGLRVMVAVDRSEHADFALKYYLTKLHNPENKVILIFNGSVDSLAGEGIEALGQKGKQQEIWEDMLRKADEQITIVRQHYEEFFAGTNIEYNVHIMKTSGNVGESIVKRAAEEQVELIVMGSRGMGTLRRTILGSVSDYVLHNAHCPVCICRPS